MSKYGHFLHISVCFHVVIGCGNPLPACWRGREGGGGGVGEGRGGGRVADGRRGADGGGGDAFVLMCDNISVSEDLSHAGDPTRQQ